MWVISGSVSTLSSPLGTNCRSLSQQATVHRVTKSWIWLSNLACTHTVMRWHFRGRQNPCPHGTYILLGGYTKRVKQWRRMRRECWRQGGDLWGKERREGHLCRAVRRAEACQDLPEIFNKLTETSVQRRGFGDMGKNWEDNLEATAIVQGAPQWLSGKESACNAGDAGSAAGLGMSMATHFHILLGKFRGQKSLAGYSP